MQEKTAQIFAAKFYTTAPLLTAMGNGAAAIVLGSRKNGGGIFCSHSAVIAVSFFDHGPARHQTPRA